MPGFLVCAWDLDKAEIIYFFRRRGSPSLRMSSSPCLSQLIFSVTPLCLTVLSFLVYRMPAGLCFFKTSKTPAQNARHPDRRRCIYELDSQGEANRNRRRLCTSPQTLRVHPEECPRLSRRLRRCCLPRMPSVLRQTHFRVRWRF